MIEVSLTEIFLFGWASLMTALYARAHQSERRTRIVLMHLIENDEAREGLVGQFKQFKEKVGQYESR
jgi:hypothetical protein